MLTLLWLAAAVVRRGADTNLPPNTDFFEVSCLCAETPSLAAEKKDKATTTHVAYNADVFEEGGRPVSALVPGSALGHSNGWFPCSRKDVLATTCPYKVKELRNDAQATALCPSKSCHKPGCRMCKVDATPQRKSTGGGVAAGLPATTRAPPGATLSICSGGSPSDSEDCTSQLATVMDWRARESRLPPSGVVVYGRESGFSLLQGLRENPDSAAWLAHMGAYNVPILFVLEEGEDLSDFHKKLFALYPWMNGKAGIASKPTNWYVMLSGEGRLGGHDCPLGHAVANNELDAYVKGEDPYGTEAGQRDESRWWRCTARVEVVHNVFRVDPNRLGRARLTIPPPPSHPPPAFEAGSSTSVQARKATPDPVTPGTPGVPTLHLELPPPPTVDIETPRELPPKPTLVSGAGGGQVDIQMLPPTTRGGHQVVSASGVTSLGKISHI